METAVIRVPIPAAIFTSTVPGTCYTTASPTFLGRPSPSTINHYRSLLTRRVCTHCKQKRKATKALTLVRLPPVLLIQLKRFSYSGGFWNRSDTPVVFPINNLDLTRLMPRREPTGAENLDDPRTQIGPFKYDLYGVTNHSGTLSSGHCECSTRERRERSERGERGRSNESSGRRGPSNAKRQRCCARVGGATRNEAMLPHPVEAEQADTRHRIHTLLWPMDVRRRQPHHARLGARRYREYTTRRS